MTTSLVSALDRVVGLFRQNQPSDFIATEFLISSDIQQILDSKTKFGRALLEAEASINRDGFQWWQPPPTLRQIIELTRQEVAHSVDDESARQVVRSLLSDSEPGFIADVHVR